MYVSTVGPLSPLLREEFTAFSSMVYPRDQDVPGQIGEASHSAAMSKPNGLLSQKVCHYLNRGRTLNGLL